MVHKTSIGCISVDASPTNAKQNADILANVKRQQTEDTSLQLVTSPTQLATLAPRLATDYGRACTLGWKD
eukprot:gene39805-55598_t